MGLIRGQPRQPWHSTGLASSQPPTPGVAGPGPQTTLRRSMSARETYRRETGYMPYQLPGLANSIPGKFPPNSACTRVHDVPAFSLGSAPRPRARSHHGCDGEGGHEAQPPSWLITLSGFVSADRDSRRCRLVA